jgi:hypothetical protein
MPNIFLSLAVTNGDGVGAASDVSTIAPLKTFVVNSLGSSGVIILEATENDVDYFPIGRVDMSSAKSRPIEFTGVLKKVRVRRIFSVPNTPLPTVTMGAEDTTVVQVFNVLNTPNNNGVGALYDCSGSGNLLTFSTVGELLKGTLSVEGSQDGGTTFNNLARFDGPWNNVNQIKPITIVGSFNRLRVTREKTLPGGDGGIQFGQGELSQGGGGGITSNTATIAEGSAAIPLFACFDAVTGDDATGIISTTMPLAGVFPFKTLAGAIASKKLATIGIGHRLVLAFKPNTFVEDFDLRSFIAYGELSCVGSTTFLNDTTDQVLSGFITAAAGPNGDGSWTCAAGWTNTAGSFAGSVAAGAFPADPAIAGYRIRFKGNITAALANCTAAIDIGIGAAISGLGLIFTSAFSTAVVPAAGDEFFIEKPGVVFTGPCLIELATAGQVKTPGTNTTGGINLRGIQWTSTTARIRGLGGSIRFAGCEFTTAPVISLIANLIVNPNITIADAVIHVGMGLRTPSFSPSFVEITGFAGIVSTASAGSRSSFQTIRQLGTIEGCRFIGGVNLSDVGANSLPGTPAGSLAYGNGGSLFGNAFNTGIYQRAKINGLPITSARFGSAAPLIISNSKMSIIGVNIVDAGANPGIALFGNGNDITFDDVIGSSGNTDVGISFANSQNGRYLIGKTVAVTITGTVGDIRVNTGGIVSYSEADRGICDSLFNTLIGASTAVPQFVADAANIELNLAAADIRRNQEYQTTLTANRIADVPINPVDGQIFTWRLKNDNGSRTMTWTGGAGGFLFGLSIPEINVVLGTGGANSYDYVTFKYLGSLNRCVCVGFLAGYV